MSISIRNILKYTKRKRNRSPENKNKAKRPRISESSNIFAKIRRSFQSMKSCQQIKSNAVDDPVALEKYKNYVSQIKDSKNSGDKIEKKIQRVINSERIFRSLFF